MSIVQKAVATVVKHLPDKAPDPLIDKEGLVGRPLSRLDGPQKVSGTARFTAEVAIEHLAFASLVCSTIAKGRIEAFDLLEAELAAGVIAIVTHQNAPKMKPPPIMMEDANGAAISRLPVMQDPLVHWNGQPIAVVVAESQEQADHAASLVRVTYAKESSTLSFDEQLAKAKPPKDVLGEPSSIRIGDAESALRDAELRIAAVYRTPRYHHNAIEPHSTMAVWDDDSHVTVHDSSQALSASRYTLAQALGLKPENIRLLAPFVGGAFGAKGVWNHQLLCIAAAKIVGRPVRLALSREDVFRIIGGRTLSEQRVALGAKADGTLTALIHRGTTGVVTHNAFPEQFSFPARHLYAAENMLIEQEVVELDMVANTSMRAPGESIGTFALESAIDELAVASGIDPIELRRRIEPQKDPTKGTAFSSRNVIEAYRRGAEQFGWASRAAKPGTQQDGEWSTGQGVATAYYPYYRMSGGSATLRLSAAGDAVVQVAAHEMGMGTATVQTQHLADRLGLPAHRVRFEYGDSNFAQSPIAGGSSQSASIAAAVIAATDALIKALLNVAGKDSPLAGSKRADVQATRGGLYRLDAPACGEPYEKILSRAGREQIECTAAAPMPAETIKYSMHSYGAQFCEVRVNQITGEIRVARWLGSFDTGRILNPKTAASQFRGGIIMGIGMALTEESFFDERIGRFMNASLAGYHVPVHLDVPRIDVIWNDIPDPHSPLGLHGIGEIGITGVAAAIANAVFHATGKRIRQLPMTLDKVLTSTAH